jgi:dihydrofolate synthase/folylpolyglutamate synthase
MEKKYEKKEKIRKKDVLTILNKIRPIAEDMSHSKESGIRHPTFFEVVTALCFKYFSEKNVEIAVLEVGMGGKLDATNIVHAIVSVITNVSLEHTEVLGETVLEIAEKKAGIIKPNGVLITATKNDDVYELFEKICEKTGSKIFRVGENLDYKKIKSNLKKQKFYLKGIIHEFKELEIPLLGEFQIINAATAVGAVESLRFHNIEVPINAIHDGLKHVKWPARLELIQHKPLVIMDAAKDIEAMKAVKKSLLSDFIYDRLISVVSISSDKKIPQMLELLSDVTDYFIFTAHKVHGRAADPMILVKEAELLGKSSEIISDVEEAVIKAIKESSEDDLILIIGSVFLVGAARALWKKI